MFLKEKEKEKENRKAISRSKFQVKTIKQESMPSSAGTDYQIEPIYSVFRTEEKRVSRNGKVRGMQQTEEILTKANTTLSPSLFREKLKSPTTLRALNTSKLLKPGTQCEQKWSISKAPQSRADKNRSQLQ